jgi:hypothetical protein
MKTLAYDMTRCAGRYDFNPKEGWCEERNTCQRYLAFTDWDVKAGVPNYQAISVTMARRQCGIKIEVQEKNNDY